MIDQEFECDNCKSYNNNHLICLSCANKSLEDERNNTLKIIDEHLKHINQKDVDDLKNAIQGKEVKGK